MTQSPVRALVTGASSGIGREFAQQLANQGYVVTVVARREDRLRELLATLPGAGHTLLAADLSSSQGLETLLEYISSERIHLLINNAGYSVLEPFYQSELGKQQNILDVNCRAVVTLAHAFLGQAERGDALINVASIVSYLPTPAQPMYSASKAFLAAFSECLWSEQQSRGVYVMGLCPGVTRTEFISTATGGESDGDTLPAAFIQTTDAVVKEALAALRKRRKAIVVTGRLNRLMMLMPRLLSRHRLIKILAVMGDPERAL
ncbi:MAG TPA: NAD(P)-dependent oxidoreductase [Spongiibacteraceae bacterium]|nr:oxidoreductase [Spongiibacteraceae bacterium]HCS28378.1 NAD(P)-dependent oxidoreductase [Spongiibacteraceae bacterium]|tara:strand:- start:1670 stop:2455 length:786 start_codon:yes stop_codon:yes gene_type:complete